MRKYLVGGGVLGLALVVLAQAGSAAPLAKPASKLGKLVLLRPPDLAAVGIFSSFVGDPTKGTAKFVTYGRYRNIGGLHSMKIRVALLQYRIGSKGWVTVAKGSAINMKPGETRHVMAPSSAIPKGAQLRLFLTPGDGNPANDIYVLVPQPLPIPE